MNGIPEALRTRTFWTSIITAIVLILTAFDVIHLDTEQFIGTIVALIAVIFGNSWVEGIQAYRQREYEHASEDATFKHSERLYQERGKCPQCGNTNLMGEFLQ